MKKLEKRKNILKEAGILLIAALLVLTAIVMVPTTLAQQPPHDVGIKSIDEPQDGYAGGCVPIQVWYQLRGYRCAIRDN